MKPLNRYFIVVLLFIIQLFQFTPSLQAQAEGGMGDGHATHRYLGSLNGTSFEALFQGGRDDGFAHFQRIGASLEQHISEGFSGGIGDGHASGTFIGGLGGISIAGIFQAGSGDGFDQAHGKGRIQEATILPVELLSFRAFAQQEEVVLEWETATELNNDFFTVERSSDGTVFEEVLQVPGAGNSLQEQHYDAVDTDPLSGTSYYRLKSTDFDGTTHYSQLEAVHFEEASIMHMQIYANPNNGSDLQIQISISKPTSAIRYELSDIWGRPLSSWQEAGGEGIIRQKIGDARAIA